MNVITLIIPTFALVVAGYLLRRYAAFGRSFWSDIERLVYYVLFPALLFGTLASRPLALDQAGPMIYTGVLSILAGMAMGYLIRWLFRLPDLTFASAFQCGFRFNAYIGFALMGGLYAQDGIATFGLLMGFIVPLANVASVWALAHHGQGGMVREIVTNPMIISTFGGLCWGALGLPLPGIVGTTLGFLGQAALPIGLLAVGAGVRLVITGQQMGVVIYLNVVKLVALPAVALWLGALLGVEGEYLAAAVVLAALPTGTAAYILAVRMGGDGPLVASITALNMLASIVTLPLWLALLN